MLNTHTLSVEVKEVRVSYSLPVASSRWGCFTSFSDTIVEVTVVKVDWRLGKDGCRWTLPVASSRQGCFASLWNTIVKVTFVKVDWGGVVAGELCLFCFRSISMKWPSPSSLTETLSGLIQIWSINISFPKILDLQCFLFRASLSIPSLPGICCPF